jgi:hypothetical protein
MLGGRSFVAAKAVVSSAPMMASHVRIGFISSQSFHRAASVRFSGLRRAELADHLAEVAFQPWF